MKLHGFLLLCSVVSAVGCNQMLAELGGTPNPESSKFFTASACGARMNAKLGTIHSYILLDVHENAPKPLYLAVAFETPEGIKTVNHQLTEEEYSKKSVMVMSAPAKGWKMGAYTVSASVYSDESLSNLIDKLVQPWRNHYDLDMVLSGKMK